MEEIIEQLRKEKEFLLIRVNKIDNAIENLESLDRKEESPIEQSRKEIRLKDAVQTVKTNAWKKSKVTKGNQKGKWTKEIIEFIKENIEMKNKDLVKEIGKKFGLKITEQALSCQISLRKLRKGKAKEKASKNDGPIKKHKCEECHENIWSAWYKGKQLCQECLEIIKKRDRGMSPKEIKKSPKDMGAEDKEETEEDPEEDLDLDGEE